MTLLIWVIFDFCIQKNSSRIWVELEFEFQTVCETGARSHVRECRPRLSTTEKKFAIFWQSYSVLRGSYGCDTYWIRTDSRSVVGSLGDATTVLKNFKLSYCSRGVHLYVRQSYCSLTAIVLAPTGSYWCVLMRTAILLSRADSYCSLTAVALNRTDSYWYVRQSNSVASIDSSSYLFSRQFTQSSISTQDTGHFRIVITLPKAGDFDNWGLWGNSLPVVGLKWNLAPEFV